MFFYFFFFLLGGILDYFIEDLVLELALNNEQKLSYRQRGWKTST